MSPRKENMLKRSVDRSDSLAFLWLTGRKKNNRYTHWKQVYGREMYSYTVLLGYLAPWGRSDSLSLLSCDFPAERKPIDKYTGMQVDGREINK